MNSRELAQLMQPRPAVAGAADRLGSGTGIVDPVGRAAPAAVDGAGAEAFGRVDWDAASVTCFPSSPRTSVTFRTESVSASTAPGTRAATAFASLCLPGGYRT